MIGAGRTCPCCGHSAFSEPVQTDGGPYLACRACKTSFQASVLDQPSMVQDKFEQEQERFYGDDSVMLAPGFEALQAEATRRRLKVVRRHLKGGKLLEVGPGNGATLAMFRENGYLVDAVEHSEVLAAQVAATTGATVHHGDFEALKFTQRYDAYMSFHVIEHVPEFIAHLTKAAAITCEGGYAFLATPHVLSLEHRVSGGLAPNFSTAHLQLFSKRGLARALERSGWDVVSTSTPEYPMSWLRVLTAFLRSRKSKGQAKARGGYASAASPRTLQLVRFFAFCSWPFRKVQEALGLGEELFIVARKRRDQPN
jgi:2-polyprenyl-3-methyl-5-hydroxy-6-metoxy-1,4-benzoquinol methylase